MPQLLIERYGSTTVLTLNRPGALNALSSELLDSLPASIQEAAADRSCRAIVITGVGERAFCAGIDVKSVAARDAADSSPAAQGDGTVTRPDPIETGLENLHIVLSNIVRIIHTLPVPVIAAVNGHAVGAGFAMAAACDLRIGSTNATFADGFVKRGISGCEMGLSYFLPKIVGPARAADLMLTGRRVNADEAAKMGIIGDAVEPADLVNRALETAAAVADNAPMAISMTKEVMWANLHASSLDHALALESRTQVLTRQTADAAEARNSFLEKRPPQFDPPAGARPLR